MYRDRRSVLSRLPKFINLRILGASITVAFLLFCVTLGMLLLTRQEPSETGPATAILNIVRAPTETVSPATPTLGTNPIQDGSIPPPPPPGLITVGAYVQITGTGGDGLRFRTDPGLSSPVRLVASEAEIFRVGDGPREVDGYVWWYLIGPFDETRTGWAVSNYLSVVQGP